ncbi:MAG: hypothetical protein R3F13_17105 [Prosthecobacter sp.]
MRRPWIKIEVSTPDKPEVCAISTRLKISEDTVMGKLVRFWSWLEINRVNPNDLGVTFEFIDKLVSKKGFAAAMEEAGWLKSEDDVLSLPKFAKYNGNDAKVRGLTAKRVARFRQRKLAEQSESDPPAPARKKKEATAPKISPVDKTPEETPPSEEPAQNEPETIVAEASPPAPSPEPEAIAPQPSESIPEVIATLESALENETPPKRRSKAERQNDDQPMLF